MFPMMVNDYACAVIYTSHFLNGSESTGHHANIVLIAVVTDSEVKIVIMIVEIINSSAV